MSDCVFTRPRSRRVLVIDPQVHYENWGVQYVDGQTKLVPTPVVYPSLAAEYDVTQNALTRQSSSTMRKRMNVDACDLKEEISKIQ